jgi:hypothetical protein
MMLQANHTQMRISQLQEDAEKAMMQQQMDAQQSQ